MANDQCVAIANIIANWRGV